MDDLPDATVDALHDLDTKKERYAALRVLGYSDCEATEMAGYASRPPDEARQLYERARQACVIQSSKVAHLRDEIEGLRQKIQRKRRTLRARRIAERFHESRACSQTD